MQKKEKGGHFGLRWALTLMPGVLLWRGRLEIQRHTGKKPCGDEGGDWSDAVAS